MSAPGPDLGAVEQRLATDPAGAADAARTALATYPDHPRALLLLGIAQRLAGRSDAALEPLERLCRMAPEVAPALLHWGLALRETGRVREAETALRRAVTAAPEYADAWLALADVQYASADKAGADKSYLQYVRCCAKDPRLQEPTAALRENRPTFPTDVAALNLLAEVAARHAQFDAAESLLERCLALAPGYHTARHNYALVLLRQGKLEAAARESDLLLQSHPANAPLRELRANVHLRAGEYAAAKSIYEALLARDPNRPAIWTSLGHVLRTLGERDRAVDAYRNAIVLAPDSGEAYWNLANLKRFEFSTSEVESMRAQLESNALTGENRVHIHFAIGKALEDKREFAESFAQYQAGNALRREQVSYDADEFTGLVRRSRELFRAEFFAARAGYGAEARDPILVVGLPRSGSTLVEQILASHSTVEGTMELPDLAIIAKSLLSRQEGAAQYPQIVAALTEADCSRLGARYLDQTRIHRKLGKPRFIDKMPNNFAHLGLIQLLLPNATLVDVRRHPLACGWSIYKHLFAYGQNFSYRLTDIGRYYRDYVELLDHFDAVLPGRIVRVHYEALVGDTESEVRRLLQACGLPFEESCLKFFENPRAVATPSSEQVRSPIFREGLAQWRHVEPWLDELKSALGPALSGYPSFGPDS